MPAGNLGSLAAVQKKACISARELPSFFGLMLLTSVTRRHDPSASQIYTACGDCSTETCHQDNVSRQMLPTGLQNQRHLLLVPKMRYPNVLLGLNTQIYSLMARSSQRCGADRQNLLRIQQHAVVHMLLLHVRSLVMLKLDMQTAKKLAFAQPDDARHLPCHFSTHFLTSKPGSLPLKQEVQGL